MAPQDDSSHALSSKEKESIQLNINGKVYEVDSSVDPSTSLLQYLREKACLKGAKGLCYEGGCGVCTVVATFVDSETGKQKTCSVAACQVLVYSCSRWVIETVEHLGNRYKGYHVLQKALAGFYGTQCGFCSPGFVMTMYGALKSSGKLTKEQVEKSLDGNLCRCTGYRPILDAFKSLAEDSPKDLAKKLIDIEDSYNSTCPKTGELCSGTCPENSSNESGCSASLSTMGFRPQSEMEINVGNAKWLRPSTLKGVYKALQDAASTDDVKLVVGNTGNGVYREDGPYDVYIDTTGIADLYTVAIGKPLKIGANVSLQRCIEVFHQVAADYSGYEYLNEIAKHWELIGNVNVRNIGCWAGNLMMKHKHKDFPSDVFVTLATVGAVIEVGHSADSSMVEVNVEDLMELDMSRNVILSMTLPFQNENTYTRTYKIAPRAVNSHAHINAGFKFELDSKDGFKVLSRPTIVIGGINPSFVQAKKTEDSLTTRKLVEEKTVKEAAEILKNELKPDAKPVDASPQYRTSLATTLFYKAVLNILGDKVGPELRSGGSILERPISSGRQNYDLNKDSWPVGQAIPKVESNIQVAGEAEYFDDVDPLCGELFGAFVQSTVANAELAAVDPSEALKVKGVVAYIDHNDIPGTNTFYENGEPDPIFVESKIGYAGQSIGLIVAEKKEIAEKAAKLVKVEYKNVKKPILTIKDAPHRKFTPPDDDYKNIPHSASGEFDQGNQFHLALEPHTSRVTPVEDGYDVLASTQWLTRTQSLLSDVLKIDSNNINMTCKRLGGGFGSKISRGNLVTCAAAVAARKLQKPVRITLDLSTNMTLVGWRDPYLTKYKVGYDDEGNLKRVDIGLYSDSGFNSNEGTANSGYYTTPNVYYSEKWGIRPDVVNTDTAANTYCRTPGIPNAKASMENVIERIAFELKKDPVEIREKNFINKEEGKTQRIAPRGENLVRTKIFPMLKQEAQYDARRAEIDKFNKENRWKKRGLSMIPLFFSLNYRNSLRFNSQVVVYAKDGTVVLSHGGVEMGQGINTKAVQVAAKILKVPINMIKVKPTNVVTGANSTITAGTVASDLIAHCIQNCCEKLRARMDVVEKNIEEMTKKKPKWKDLVQACFSSDVDLSERFWNVSETNPDPYDIFAAACIEVEVDVLTGQYLIHRADIIEDCGQSMSPYVDIGQIEGAFVMGLGLYTSEEVKYDPENGQKLSIGTWDYNPPTALDIPVDMRITLLPKGDNKFGVLRSKATGEPALCLSYCIVTALRDAIKSARADAGDSSWFEMSTPLTVERIQQLCKVDSSQFDLNNKSSMLETAQETDEDFHLIEKRDVTDFENYEETNGGSCTLH